MTYTGNQQHRKRHDDKSYLFLLSIPCGRGDLRDLPIFHVGIAISTHAPAGGATRSSSPARQAQTYFYSRPCGRGDNDRALLYEMPKIISTHAPAGGATSTTFRPLLSARISTHAPAGGATWAVVAVPVVTSAFLLTSLREGRHVALPRFFCIALTFLLTSLREGRLAPRTR